MITTSSRARIAYMPDPGSESRASNPLVDGKTDSGSQCDGDAS